MRSSLPRFSLPLLAKELVEQAARKRMYRVRTLYAVVLFAFSLLIVHSFFQYAGSNPLNVLGRGGIFLSRWSSCSSSPFTCFYRR